VEVTGAPVIAGADAATIGVVDGLDALRDGVPGHGLIMDAAGAERVIHVAAGRRLFPMPIRGATHGMQ
jgi:hypothetical protein